MGPTDRPRRLPLGEKVIRIGIIGYGYWGPVVARNFHNADGCQLAAICDTSLRAQARAQPNVFLWRRRCTGMPN